MASNRKRSNSSIGNKVNRIDSKVSRTEKSTQAPHLDPEGIISEHLGTESVSERTIAPRAVTEDKLARGAVGTEHLGVVNEITSDSNLAFNAGPGLIYINGQQYTATPPAGSLYTLAVGSDGEVVVAPVAPGSGGGGGGGGTSTFRRSMPPSGLSASSAGVWDQNGLATSVLIVEWLAPTVGVDGAPIVINMYEVFFREEGTAESASQLLVSTASTGVNITPIAPDKTYYLKVRAFSEDGAWSAFSVEVPVQSVNPAPNLEAPSTPVASTNAGNILISWDGLLGGTTPPRHFSHVFVGMAETVTGTYVPVGQSLVSNGSVVVSGVPDGITRWFRLYAMDKRGTISPPSDPVFAVSISAASDSGLKDAVEGIVKDMQAQAEAIETVRESADGKSTIYRQPGTPPGTDYAVGDTWFDSDDDGKMYNWDGADWQATEFGAGALADTVNDAITQAASGAQEAQSAVDLLEREILSRGTDLVTNGDGSMGDNTNFSAFSYGRGDTPVGTQGMFTVPSGQTSRFTDKFISVNPTKQYAMSVWAKQQTPGISSRFYTVVAPYDAEGLAVVPQNYMEQANTRTTLAAPLSPGDTSISLTSSANWNNAAGANNHLRTVIVWNYVDGFGKLWKPGEYSRNVTANAYADGGVDTATHVVTLQSPWAGKAAPAGTAISNGSSGGNYIYPTANAVVADEWTLYKGTSLIGGIHTNNLTPAAFAFPLPTAKVRVGFLVNYSVAGGTSSQSFAGFSFSEVAAAAQLAESAQTSADGKNKIWYENSAPVGTHRIGDTWFDTNDGYKIYRWNGTWSASELGTNAFADLSITNSKIGTLDAGKITTGELDALRIGANTISTKQLLVADFSNLVEDPGFESSKTVGGVTTYGLGWTGWGATNPTNVTTTPRTGARAARLKAGVAAYVALASLNAFRVEAGDKYVLGFWVRAEGAGTTIVGGAAVRANWGATEAGTTTSSSDIAIATTILGATWTYFSGVWTVPAGAKFARIHVVIRDTGNTNVYLVDDINAYKQVPGVLIQDGAITAGSAIIANGAITNANIKDATIEYGKIASLDASKISTGTMHGDYVTAGTISTAKLAVSDTSNMAQLTELPADAGKIAYAGVSNTVVSGWSGRSANTSDFFMFRNQTGPVPFKTGDSIRITYEAYAAADTSVTPMIWVYGNASAAQSFVVENLTTVADEYSSTMVVTMDTVGKTQFLVGFSGALNKTIFVRNVRVQRMNAGELVVDGTITTAMLRAGLITADKVAADAITAVHIQARTIGADKLAANTITANEIAGGTITGALIAGGTIQTSHLAADIGGQLDISANSSINLLVGQVGSVQSDVNATEANLTQMQTYYSFGTNGAVIGKPGSPFTLALRSDRIEMLENGNVVSYWNSGQMHVSDFVGERVILGNHQLEKLGTSTVVRTL